MSASPPLARCPASRATRGAMGAMFVSLLGAAIAAGSDGAGPTTAHGGRGLQERSGAQGDSRQPVHGDDGVLFGVARRRLHVLPCRGERRQLGKVCRRQRAQADGAPDDADGVGHQSDELWRPAGGHLLHVSSRRQSSQGDGESRGAVRRVATGGAGRCDRAGGVASRGAVGGPDSRQIHSRARRRRRGWPASRALPRRARTRRTRIA